jgi:Domain of unknown function (DUF4034)
MKCRLCSLTHPARTFQTLSAAIRMSSIAILLLILFHGLRAAATDRQGQSAARPCAFSDAAFDTATNVHALDEYYNAISQLLKEEQFVELDCLADAARAGKTRFSGGAWKLRQFYVGLESPRPGHPTQEDWRHHLDLVGRWKHKNPRSVTAPIVLAESYINYAWDARGDGYSDSVSDSGWKLFGERISKAKAILDQAAPAKCPDWYVAMQKVARGQSWDLPQHYALLQQAIAFEPGYQYYYRIHADYLQPKWSGEEGDPARFAEESANHLEGDAGDILYFQIAEGILCACKESEFGHFSWPRLQKGFTALEKQYGTSMISVNSFALMASKSGDWQVADPAFKRIGDNWNEELWTSEAWFKQNRDTAAGAAPMQARARATRKEAEENMQTPEGQTYRRELEQKLAGYEQTCLKESSGDARKFEFFVQVGKNGSAANAQTETRPDGFAFCLMRTLYLSYTNKETPLPVPPHDGYWVLVELDPANLAASAK